MGQHGWYAIEQEGRDAVAVCQCGWRSEAALNPGVAGVLWDEHVGSTSSESTGGPDVSAHVRARRRAAIADALGRVRAGRLVTVGGGVTVLASALDAALAGGLI